MPRMNVLVACEESQEVCKAFREQGHNAYSCDVRDCSGGHPEWHIKENVLSILGGGVSFQTCDGVFHDINGLWDIVIAHPPCTYLCVSGNRWFFEDYPAHVNSRYRERMQAIEFFMEIAMCSAKHVCIENPVGIMNTIYRKPDQIIQPYMFGEPYEKKTCLWLRRLPELQATSIVEPEPRQHVKSGKTLPTWYSNAKVSDRAAIRARTFPGIAQAMAEQWGTNATLF